MRSLSYMFGDNKSVVDSSMTPNGKVHKFHVALSLHRFRKYIATEIFNYLFTDGKHNPSETLGKHWTHNDIWFTIRLILFSPGDTMECFDSDSLE